VYQSRVKTRLVGGYSREGITSRARYLAERHVRARPETRDPNDRDGAAGDRLPVTARRVTGCR